MSKEDNFGGIQPTPINDIINLVTPPRTNGLTDASVIDLLLAVVGAQTTALNPGAGQAGFIDAYKVFDDVTTALAKVKNASAATINGEAANLTGTVKEVSKLLAKGPVPAGFFTIAP